MVYNFNALKETIEHDWNVEKPPVHKLVKEYLSLTEDTLEDGALINEVVIIEQSGPCLKNNLSTVPSRFPLKYDFIQLMQTRIPKCKISVTYHHLYIILIFVIFYNKNDKLSHDSYQYDGMVTIGYRAASYLSSVLVENVD